MGMTSYIQDIMEDVVQGHVREGGDTYIAVNPLFHIMALGFFMAVGPESGEYHHPDARTAGGRHPGSYPAVTRSAGYWACRRFTE